MRVAHCVAVMLSGRLVSHVVAMAWRNEWIMNTTLFSSDQMCLVVSLNFLGTDFALLNDRGMKHIRICLNCLLLQLPLIHSVDILNWHAKGKKRR